MATEHTLDRKVDATALAADLSARLGRDVAVKTREPGQTDEDGESIPGVVIVADAANGDALDVDGRTVAAAVAANEATAPVEPLTDDEIIWLRAFRATQ